MENFSGVQERVFEDILRRALLLMLDFDGTLAPIVPRPDDARMSPRTKNALVRCVHAHTVAIISGRTLDDIERRAGIPGIWYAGSHGMEWRLGSEAGSVGIPLELQGALSSASAILETISAHYSGTIIERKGKSFAINYRALSAEDASKFSAEGHKALREYAQSRALRIIDATRTFEIAPEVHWDKGSCVRMMLAKKRSTGEAPLPMFIGDSATDEDAFRELKEGVTIRVGQADVSSAQYYVAQRDDVDAILERLASIPPSSHTSR